jgi:hypothetical protein
VRSARPDVRGDKHNAVAFAASRTDFFDPVADPPVVGRGGACCNVGGAEAPASSSTASSVIWRAPAIHRSTSVHPTAIVS